MKHSPKGTKLYVHVSGTSRCYNLGQRQAPPNVVPCVNNKSSITRINPNTVKRVVMI
jgi:hypothetical protein